jgi:LmbE family N-acetylglucosaminyl deacetylase
MNPTSHRALTAAASLLALLLPASLPLSAQRTPQLQDPANLTGERVSAPDLADTLPIDHGAPALQQLLLKLRTRASFMLIVAHPDDEDGGLLTYLSRGQGARVAMLTLNRGEGGQNLMSADFDDALGLIRTQELLAADRTMGVDQFFGTEVDFGFSKTKEESFAKWTRQRVLYDAVRAVRLYRPLVIASVFIGGPTDGHGQHQVAGQIAQEVFNAAGDPNVFPDQIAAGLQPWQPLKVYARVPYARINAQGMFDSATNQYTPARFTNYVTGNVTTTIPRANVVIPEGDPATYTAPDGTKTPIPGMDGLSYLQFAREGLALQKTQIGPNARLASPGPHDVAYHRYASCVSSANGNHIPGPDDTHSPGPHSECPIHRDSAMNAPSAASPTTLPQTEPAPEFEGTEPSLFTGIDTSFAGMATLVTDAPPKLRSNLQKIDDKIAEAQRLFNPANPELTAPPLRLALATLNQFLHELEDANVNDLDPLESYNLLHELRIKRVQLNNALVLALGLKFDVTSATLLYTTATSAQVTATLSNEGNVKVDYTNLILPGSISTRLPNQVTFADNIIAPHSSSFNKETIPFASGLPATRPYFSRKNIEQPFYYISQPDLRNAPETPAPIILSAHVRSGADLELKAVAHDPALDSTTAPDQRQPAPIQPLVAIPPVSISLSRSTTILRPGEKSVQAVATVSAEQPIQKLGGVKVFLDRPNTTPELLATAFPEEYSKVTGEPEQIGISADAHKIDDHSSTLTVAVAQQGREYSEGFRAVGYGDLPHTNYYTPAALRIVPVDVTTAPGLNIAYLAGTGDDVPSALDQLGIHAHILTAADLTPAALKPYDAIILGVRAYEHSNLAAANPALNAYAANGGIVIAQYNTGHLPEGTGPYPLSLGDSEKVVEEDAPVHILTPTDPLLTWPNQITSADFDHWVEERGHGFMGTWDPHYQALLETHDLGQQPQRGSLLVARSGRGAWIYLGLALYRQFPEGVPGAYRILANLISAAKNPAFAK